MNNSLYEDLEWVVQSSFGTTTTNRRFISLRSHGKMSLGMPCEHDNQAVIAENQKNCIQESCKDIFVKKLFCDCSKSITEESFSGFQIPQNTNIEKIDKRHIQDHGFLEEDAKSDLIYYTVSWYRALYKRKQHTRCSRSTSLNIKELKVVEKSNKEKCIKTLKKNIVLQMSTLNQANKALNYCYSFSNHDFLPQVVECERLLLLSSHRYYEMTKMLRCLKANKQTIYTIHREQGTIRISKLFLYFNNLMSVQKDSSDTKWYMCMVSHEENIEGSKVYFVPKNDKMLRINDIFTFKNLSNDFVINIQIFSLESKRLTKQWKKCYKKLKMSCGRLISSDLLTPEDCKPSDFKLEGSFCLKLQDLKSMVFGEFAHGSFLEFQLMWDVDSKVHLSGFLEIEKDIGEYKVWDRKWCILEGCVLKYWNYPSDKEYMPPLGILDLRYCVASLVKPVDKERNPWHRTFVLEMVEGNVKSSTPGQTMKQILREFFRADSSKELSDWCLVLNEHIALLRKWKLNAIDDTILS